MAGDEDGENAASSTPSQCIRPVVGDDDGGPMATQSLRPSLLLPWAPQPTDADSSHTNRLTLPAEVPDAFDDGNGRSLEMPSRADRLDEEPRSLSAPASARGSLESDIIQLPPHGLNGYPIRADDVPLADLGSGQPRRTYALHDLTDGAGGPPIVTGPIAFDPSLLDQFFAQHYPGTTGRSHIRNSTTSSSDSRYHDSRLWRGHFSSIIPSLSSSIQTTPHESLPSTGASTPAIQGANSQGSTECSPASSRSSTTSLTSLVKAVSQAPRALFRMRLPRLRYPRVLTSAMHRLMHSPEDLGDVSIHVHAAVSSRKEYLLKLCRALMMHGAPTHRLEEYLQASACKLKIESHFFYLPGCMMISFEDQDAQITETRMIKVEQGIDLGRFQDTFEIYNKVTHGQVSVDTASIELDKILNRSDKFGVWIRILAYGSASALVGPFAFNAGPTDLGPSFGLGCVVGILQLYLAPRKELYAHLLAVSASIFTSGMARALGSISYNDGQGTKIFCFSAIAQSSIALILPGYVILSASLELQTRNMISGSVRMVYAFIYSLMLGFGITVGAAIYGGFAGEYATSALTCPIPEQVGWRNINEDLVRFVSVSLFTLCLMVINQAKWSEAPAMLVVSCAGYEVNFWSAKRFANNVQIASALGAFVIGTLANLYASTRSGFAAATILPAIFVQVPSGLAASGSLVSGLTAANQITGHAFGISVINNGAQGFADAQESSKTGSSGVYTGAVFNLSYGMAQVALGITLGLLVATLLISVLPIPGKKRNGLFSF
jgi:uncharacterized membrane protein YjjP (DUF1212 family)